MQVSYSKHASTGFEAGKFVGKLLDKLDDVKDYLLSREGLTQARNEIEMLVRQYDANFSSSVNVAQKRWQMVERCVKLLKFLPGTFVKIGEYMEHQLGFKVDAKLSIEQFIACMYSLSSCESLMASVARVLPDTLVKLRDSKLTFEQIFDKFTGVAYMSYVTLPGSCLNTDAKKFGAQLFFLVFDKSLFLEDISSVHR